MSIASHEPNASQVRAADFPHFGEPQEQLRFLLHYAVLAPSSHNTQPWLWEINGDEIELRADRSRQMPALDADGRELIMSCGAALQHLRLAIRVFGYADLVSILPDSQQPDLLARVRLSLQREAAPDDKLLFRFIAERHTNRQAFDARELSSELMQLLQQEAEKEGASLHLVQVPILRSAVTNLIQYGTLVQSRDSAVRRDEANSIATSRKRNDGIPTRSLGISDWLSNVAPFAHRVLDRSEARANTEGQLAGDAPVMVVLCTENEGPEAWIAAGQALGRVLLRARAADVWASFFNQPIQVDNAWLALRHVLKLHSYPQLMFRLGYAALATEPIIATPRRPVDEVTTVTIEGDN